MSILDQKWLDREYQEWHKNRYRTTLTFDKWCEKKIRNEDIEFKTKSAPKKTRKQKIQASIDRMDEA